MNFRYSEPWAIPDQGHTSAKDCEGRRVAIAPNNRGDHFKRSGERMQRIVECVNACAGIPHPGPAIETAKVSIRQASAELLAEIQNDPDAISLRRALSDLNSAAVLLGMEPEDEA